MLEDGGGDDRALAASVRRQMAGGVDLVKLLSSEDLAAKPQRVENKRKTVEKWARKKLQVERELQDLARREDDLVGLGEELRERDREAKRLRLYEDALRRLRLEEEAVKIQGRLRGLPEATAILRGGELERLDEIEARLGRERQRREVAQAELAGAQRRMEENRIPEEALAEGVLPGLKGMAAQVRERERRLLDRREVAETRARVFEDLVEGWGWEGEELESRSEAVLECLEGNEDRLEALLADFQEVLGQGGLLRAERRRLEEAKRTLLEAKGGQASSGEMARNGCPPLERERIHRGLSELERVLTWSALNPWVLVLVLGAEGALLLSAPLWVGLVFGGVAVLGFAGERWLRLRRFRGSGLGERFGRDPLQAFERLQGELVRREKWEGLEGEVEALARRQEELRRREEELEEEAAGLREAMGLEPGLGSLRLVDWARRVFRLREAREELWAARAQWELARREFEEERGALVGRLVSVFGAELGGRERLEAMGGAELSQLVERLGERVSLFREARGDAEQAEKRLEDAGEGERLALKEREALFQRLGLEVGDRQALEEAAKHRATYVRERKALDRVEGELDELDRALAGAPELRGADTGTLEARIEGAKFAQRRAEDLRIEMGKVQGEIENTKRSKALAQALDALEEARVEWTKASEEEAHKALARGLLRAVLEESAEQTETPVFEKAKDLFSQFTRGRLELKLKPADGEKGEAGEDRFYALDRERERSLSLGELSDGTRSQLLLAARMAFATVEERGVSLPIFLDEALSHADDVRYRAIVDALLSLVREGRQVILLTADEADVSRVSEQVRESGLEDRFQLVRLPEHLGIPPEGQASYLLPRPQIPHPQGRSPSEYAALLRVPAPSLLEAPGALHLYYLLDDNLPLLHSLLLQGYSTVAQLTSPQKPKGDTHGLQARCALWLRFRELWDLNRPGPVFPKDLEESPLKKSTFLPDVRALVPETGIRFSELQFRLEEISGLRKKTKEALEEWARGSGLLFSDPPLSEEEILREISVDSPLPSEETYALLRRFMAGFREPLERSGQGSPWSGESSHPSSGRKP
ncbi:MAG TPA: hypothetical protein ENK02_11340 [Planctomycetes bacterium]|nr:hypothetical protein [Planctomycetota bacterium]